MFKPESRIQIRFTKKNIEFEFFFSFLKNVDKDFKTVSQCPSNTFNIQNLPKLVYLNG